jgi:hypothetical protein
MRTRYYKLSSRLQTAHFAIMFTKIRGRLGTGQDDISLKFTKISKYHDTHDIFIIQTFRK